MVPQQAYYSQLFESYKIDKIVLKVRYKCGGLYANTDITAGRPMQEVNPIIYVKADHDDITPDAVAVLLQSSRTKEKQLRNDMPYATFTIIPAIQSEVYKSTIASAYAPKWGTFLPAKSPAIPHYGMKMQVETPDVSTNADYGSLTLQAKMYFTMKNND